VIRLGTGVRLRDQHRAPLGCCRPECGLNPTPIGDIAVVYLEGNVPISAHQAFAVSQKPYDRWFKDQPKESSPRTSTSISRCGRTSSYSTGGALGG
jgi:hypothetical protein